MSLPPGPWISGGYRSDNPDLLGLADRLGPVPALLRVPYGVLPPQYRNRSPRRSLCGEPAKWPATAPPAPYFRQPPSSAEADTLRGMDRATIIAAVIIAFTRGTPSKDHTASRRRITRKQMAGCAQRNPPVSLLETLSGRCRQSRTHHPRSSRPSAVSGSGSSHPAELNRSAQQRLGTGVQSIGR